MRGKAPFEIFDNPLFGITPAYAGKRQTFSVLPLHQGDHPRVCGEKYTTLPAPIPPTGSPPRMRGKESLDQILREMRGITPAYAGKRPRRRFSFHDWQDHPRVCGEKMEGVKPKWNEEGSPPRMRGKETKTMKVTLLSRITPAYAGKRWLLRTI